MSVLLYVLLAMVAILAAALVRLWRFARRLGRQGNALRLGLDDVRRQLAEHTGPGHESRLLVITDNPTPESADAMKAAATEWGWKA